MSDFLQFVDRIPTLPNRKKITFENDNSIKYATVEYADEPAEVGTFLNKANFNRLNRILGYEKIVGTYNPTTDNVEYTYPYFTSDDLVDNMRVLVQANNKVQAPATDFNTLKTLTFSNNFYAPKIYNISDGNVVVLYNYQANGYYGILSKTGETIKSFTSYSSNSGEYQTCLEMSNGNILIAYSQSSGNYSGYIVIIDKNGNIIKSQTLLYSYFANIQALEMSNGNIMLVGQDSYGSGTNGNYIIIDKSGNIIKSKTSLNSNFLNIQELEMSNGNIIVIGTDSNTNGNCYYSIIDNTGTIVKSRTLLGANLSYPQMVEMNNGNILIVGTTTGQNTNYIIIKQNGDVVKTITSFSGNIYQPKLIKMSNGNHMLAGSGRYIGIINSQGNISKNFTTISDTSLESMSLLEMSNGNIIISGYVNNNSYQLNVLILDKQGNVVLSNKFIENKYRECKLIENIDGNIMIIGYSGTSQYEGHLAILEPISTSGSAAINNINLDTILVKDSYYELVYNESQNKFIAEEVRNAN